MNLLSWILIAALIEEYKALIVAIIIAIPLVLVNPIIGLIGGILVYKCLSKCKGEEE